MKGWEGLYTVGYRKNIQSKPIFLPSTLRVHLLGFFRYPMSPYPTLKPESWCPHPVLAPAHRSKRQGATYDISSTYYSQGHTSWPVMLGLHNVRILSRRGLPQTPRSCTSTLTLCATSKIENPQDNIHAAWGLGRRHVISISGSPWRCCLWL